MLKEPYDEFVNICKESNLDYDILHHNINHPFIWPGHNMLSSFTLHEAKKGLVMTY